MKTIIVVALATYFLFSLYTAYNRSKIIDVKCSQLDGVTVDLPDLGRKCVKVEILND